MQTNYTITRLKHSELKPAPFNRHSIDGHTRSGFDSKSLNELAESIRIQGIVQPLIVRKIPKGGFEIVAGERRWTAAGLVNKKFDLPCIVRQLTDAEAREINAIENLQRVGLHPIEEARGYQDLLELEFNPRYTIEKIAEKVGKSPAFVYARLKLLRAPELAQKASFKGKLTHSNLLLVARIPDPKLAHQATLEILSPYTADEKSALDPAVEPMSYRTAKKHIQDKYMIRLKDAPFDTEDADLVPTTWSLRHADGKTETTHQLPEKPPIGTVIEQTCGGKCGDCPFLTGNMKALFADVESSDVCTNTPCYKKKVSADFKRRTELAKAEGHTVMKDTKAERLFHDGQLSQYQTDFVDIDAPCPTDKKGRSWNDVLGEHVPDKLTQARDDQGKVHFLLPMAEVIEAAQAAKVKLPETRSQSDATTAEDRAKQAAERERAVAIARSVEAEVLVTLRSKVAKLKPTAELWRGIVFELLGRSELLERYDLKDDKALAAFLKKKDEGELRALMVEALWFHHNVDWNGEFRDSFIAGCKEFDVDYKAIHKRILKAADAKPDDFKKALDAVSPETKQGRATPITNRKSSIVNPK